MLVKTVTILASERRSMRFGRRRSDPAVAALEERLGWPTVMTERLPLGYRRAGRRRLGVVRGALRRLRRQQYRRGASGSK